MAKQSMKQQIYQSIANSQVQKVMSQKRDQEIAQLQADYDAWAKQQAEIQQLQADYDAWLKENNPQPVQTQPVQQATVNEIKQQIPSIADYDKTADNLQYRQAKRNIALRDKQREDYQRQQQMEQELADPRYAEKEKKKTEFKQLSNLADYQAAMDAQKKQTQNNYDDLVSTVQNMEKADKWLDPSYKLSKEEEKEAKKVAETELAKLKGRSLTDEEKARKQTFEDLKTKTSNFRSFAVGAADKALDYGKFILQGVADTQSRQLAAQNETAQAMGVNTGLTNEELSGIDEETKENIQRLNDSTADIVQNVKTQSPRAYGRGQMSTQLAAYMLTNPAFDSLGTAVNAGRIGSFAANQVGQNAQDLVLEELPMLQKAMNDGDISEEERNEILKTAGYNAVGNLIPGIAMEGVNSVIAKRAADAASNEAFRQNVKQGADYLEYINKNGITGLEPKANEIPQIDPTTAANNDFTRLMNEYNNTFKDDSAMRNIYSEEDLDGSLNKQLSEALADNSKASVKKPQIDNINAALDKVNAGRTTYIKDFYEGPKPVSLGNSERIEIAPDTYNRALDIYNKAKQDGSFGPRLRQYVKQLYESKYKDPKYGRVILNNVSFNDGDYVVEIGHRALKEAIDKGHLSPEKIATLEKLDDLLADSEFIDSGLPKYHGTTNKSQLVRYDYFETPITINGKNYIVGFDVEVNKGGNRYKTHKVVNEINLIPTEGQGLTSNITETTASKGLTDGIGVTPDRITGIPTQQLERSLSNSNIADAISEVNKKSVKNIDMPQDAQEKILSDFEQIYNSMDDMNAAAEASGNAKAIEKFEKLQQSVFEYEDSVWKSESLDDVNKAKKKADAARQAFVREMQKTDPNYRASLTGTKLGNAEFRRTSTAPTDSALLDEIVDDMVKQDMDNPNRFVKDANKTDIPVNAPVSGNGELEIHTIHGRNGREIYQVVSREGDLLTPVEPGKTFNTREEAEKAIDQYRTMAESISKPKSDIITSEPIEPGKYEIPDTPENAPKDVPPVDGMKERGTSKHIRNDGTPMRMEGVSDEVVSDFKDNPDMYKALKNSDTLSKAEKIYNESSDALVDFRDMVRNHDPAALPLGHQLAKDYSAAGNHEAAAQIYREMGEQLTKAGQFSQAAAINMMKNDPLTARAYFERELDALNKAGADKYGKKWKDFVLTDEERALFDKIAPGDSEAIKNAIDKIGVRIEKEYPASAWEKVLEFRRVAMLFNTRTIVRNTLANPPTAALRYVSDRIEALGQYAAHLIDPDFEVTQAIRGSNLETRKLAKEVYNSSKVKSLLEGGTGRLSEIPSVGDYAKSKQMFKGGFVSDWVNKMTNGGVEKLNAKLGKENAKSLLELTRSSAYKALEVTDNPMVRENFISRLGSYIRAKGIKNAADVPDEAILMAYEEAMKATYKDNSFMVQAIRNFKSGIERTGNHIIPGLGDMASQALIPYVQAPGNIAARTIDYSGIGFGKGIAKIVKGASANDVKMISKGIEEASKGATGSLMAALGYALYKSGVITGTYSNDNDQKAFEKKNGFREFAFRYKVNGQTKYDTIDWMQPFVDTIMPGVLLAQAIENSDKYDSDILRYFGFEGTKLGKVTGVAKEGVKKNVNYFFDSTPLKNLGELFKGNYGKETDLAGNLWENTVEDFASALVPAGVNAVTKSVDPIQRQTYDPSNAFGTFVNGVAAKLPKVSEALPVKYDTWGQPMTYGNSKGEAAFAKMLYPGEHTSDKADETDKELNRLFETTGSNAVFPQVAPSKVNGEKINNKEVSQYQQDVGVRNKLLVDGFINSSYYDALEDTDKADKIAKLYGVSKAITERDKFGKEVSENSEYKKAIEAYDEAGGGEKGVDAVINHYTAKKITDDAGINANSKVAEQVQDAVANGNMQEAQKIAKNEGQKLDMYEKYGLDNNSTSKKVYEDYGESGLKDLSAMKSKGLGATATYVYESAKKEVSSSELPSIETFASTYKKIDNYGNSNGSVNQKEFLAYAKKNNLSESEAQKQAQLYGDWKQIPYLKKDGSWGFHKAK